MVIHPDDRDRVFAQYKAFRAKRGDSYSIEYRAIHSSGRVLYIRETAEWILDDGGMVMQIVPIPIQGLPLHHRHGHRCSTGCVISWNSFVGFGSIVCCSIGIGVDKTIFRGIPMPRRSWG